MGVIVNCNIHIILSLAYKDQYVCYNSKSTFKIAIKQDLSKTKICKLNYKVYIKFIIV
ncbi:protein of unknown function [Clostridium beijerinckii]|nr:protein of unknown function [Clostridium beijerinckii]